MCSNLVLHFIVVDCFENTASRYKVYVDKLLSYPLKHTYTEPCNCIPNLNLLLRVCSLLYIFHSNYNKQKATRRHRGNAAKSECAGVLQTRWRRTTFLFWSHWIYYSDNTTIFWTSLCRCRCRCWLRGDHGLSTQFTTKRHRENFKHRFLYCFIWNVCVV